MIGDSIRIRKSVEFFHSSYHIYLIKTQYNHGKNSRPDVGYFLGFFFYLGNKQAIIVIL